MIEPPIQASPVDRAVLLERFVIELPAGKDPEGKDAFVDVVSGPEPNDRAYFSPKRNPRLAECWTLSPYAAGRSFRAARLL